MCQLHVLLQPGAAGGAPQGSTGAAGLAAGVRVGCSIWPQVITGAIQAWAGHLRTATATVGTSCTGQPPSRASQVCSHCPAAQRHPTVLSLLLGPQPAALVELVVEQHLCAHAPQGLGHVRQVAQAHANKGAQQGGQRGGVVDAAVDQVYLQAGAGGMGQVLGGQAGVGILDGMLAVLAAM